MRYTFDQDEQKIVTIRCDLSNLNETFLDSFLDGITKALEK